MALMWINPFDPRRGAELSKTEPSNYPAVSAHARSDMRDRISWVRRKAKPGSRFAYSGYAWTIILAAFIK